MKHITWVKKINADGTPCRKCLDIMGYLERERLIGRIDHIAIADERDPESEGIHLATRFSVERAPFFIVEEQGGETHVFEVFSQFRSYLLKQPELFDVDGFLLDSIVWNQETSILIAETEGIAPLTVEHWALINTVRGYYIRYAVPPSMRQVCRSANVEKETIWRMFGGCRRLWRVAGLPNPGEEAKSYML